MLFHRAHDGIALPWLSSHQVAESVEPGQLWHDGHLVDGLVSPPSRADHVVDDTDPGRVGANDAINGLSDRVLVRKEFVGDFFRQNDLWRLNSVVVVSSRRQ